MSSVETGQMSAVETGQMSAAETGQMSAVETGQMSAVETGQMTAAETSVFLNRRHLFCLNNTLFVSQKQAKGPTHGIATDFDNRMVTFQTDHTPQNRIAVRF